MADKQSTLVSAILSPDEMRAKTKISEDFYSVFCNHVRIAASATEFRLFFGENYPTATGEIKVIENFSVILTPVQAKAMLQGLAETVQKMEAFFGAIPNPDSLQIKDTSLPAAPVTEG